MFPFPKASAFVKGMNNRNIMLQLHEAKPFQPRAEKSVKINPDSSDLLRMFEYNRRK